MKYLIYGAYGYTGKLIAALAKSKGHTPILAGRDKEKTEALANELGLEYLSFSLEDAGALAGALQKVDAVIHCAGPFSKTARPMMEECIRQKTHYLDITGEIEVFELAASLDEQAKNAGIVLMPGVGFDVVPSDCLAAYLKSKMPAATHLEMGFKGVSQLSRGTALTMAENMHKGGMIRENGQLKEVPGAYKTREEQVNGKPTTFVSIPWGDVSTAWYSTQIPNIVIYTGVHPKQVSTMKTLYSIRWIFKWQWIQKMIRNKIEKTIHGPDEKLRDTGSSYLWGEISNAEGKKVRAHLITPESYKLTSITALMALEGLGSSKVQSGFSTPSMAFGPDFIMQVNGTQRWDD